MLHLAVAVDVRWRNESRYCAWTRGKTRPRLVYHAVEFLGCIAFFEECQSTVVDFKPFCVGKRTVDAFSGNKHRLRLGMEILTLIFTRANPTSINV